MAFWAKTALFIGGMAASTLGVKILTSKTAKFTHTPQQQRYVARTQ